MLAAEGRTREIGVHELAVLEALDVVGGLDGSSVVDGFGDGDECYARSF